MLDTQTQIECELTNTQVELQECNKRWCLQINFPKTLNNQKNNIYIILIFAAKKFKMNVLVKKL